MHKKWFLISLVVLLILFSGCSKETTSLERGDRVFGDFTTTDIADAPVNDQVFKGHKLTMVNIWATFCGPCINEMPALAALHEEYGDDFQVIGIIVDIADMNGNVLPQKLAEAVAIIDSTGADYLHLLPSKSLNDAYLNTVQAVPETIFVDENGNQVGESYLGSRSKDAWKEIIDSLLENME